MSSEMAVGLFWMARIDLLGKELDDFGKVRWGNPLDMDFGHRRLLSSAIPLPGTELSQST
jgi:hypothetical protein